jgi:DNA-binding GntR family transcriptional regulator
LIGSNIKDAGLAVMSGTPRDFLQGTNSSIIVPSRIPLAAVVEYRTIQDLVTDRVRAAILSGRFQPGQRVQQDGLARELGVSRMPVREALRILASEGLVEHRPHRGAVVVDLRSEDIAEIFEIRSMIESRAARLAGPKLTDEQITHLRAILDQMDLSEQDYDRWLRLNNEFHTSIYPASGWPRLCALIESQRIVVQPYIRAALALSERTRSARDEHWAIYEGAASRDGERLAQLTEEHLRTTARHLIAILATRRPEGGGNGEKYNHDS